MKVDVEFHLEDNVRLIGGGNDRTFIKQVIPGEENEKPREENEETKSKNKKTGRTKSQLIKKLLIKII